MGSTPIVRAFVLLALCGGAAAQGFKFKVKEHLRITESEGGFTGTLDPGAAFGFSSTLLGDLDDDGVDDLAIGAPRRSAQASIRWPQIRPCCPRCFARRSHPVLSIITSSA